MIGISRFEDLATELTRFFQTVPASNPCTRIVGLVFCQLNSQIGREEILPSIDYFNFRSGNNVNFYFLGYHRSTGPDKAWGFDAADFNECRKGMEASSKWRYSGGTDLILANVKFDAATGFASANLASIECFTFEVLKHAGVLPNVGMFFEKIFQFCEECRERGILLNNGTSGPAGNATPSRGLVLKGKVEKASEFSGTGPLSVQLRSGMQSSPPDPYAQLKTEVDASIKRILVSNTELRATVSQLQAATGEIKEVISPVREMYKDVRMIKVKSEALRANVPEIVIDTIVSEFHTVRFPRIGQLMNQLHATGVIKQLESAGHGTKRATIARWLKTVRDIFIRQGHMTPKKSSRAVFQAPPPEIDLPSSAIPNTLTRELDENSEEPQEDPE